MEYNVDYLDHVINLGKLTISEKSTNAIYGLNQPPKVTKLKSILRLCNGSRPFVPKFAGILAPAKETLTRDQPFYFDCFNGIEVQALSSLHAKFLSLPLLAVLRTFEPYVLDAYACNMKIGCIVPQDRPDWPEMANCYWSQLISKTENAYIMTHRECPYFVWAVILLKAYLEGSPFTMCTDNTVLG